MRKSRIFILTSLILCVFTVMATATYRLSAGAFYAAENDSAKITSDTAKLGSSAPEKSIIDEVIWVVGDEAILLSDVEAQKAQMEVEGIKFTGDPDYTIPEQIAVQKLFLHQAALDSIEVTESEISNGVDQQINYWVSMIGSQEKLEEYRKMTMTQIRQSLHDDFKNRQLVEKMREKLVGDIKVTPSEVKAYFKNLPEDSIPYVPDEVEVEIITRTPKAPIEEINKVKDELRSYTERVTSGRSSFSALARMYSEDPGSARNGGELDYTGRGMLDPAFAAVAFNLTDPKKVSKIVESEFGYHIIQLVDKRGDKIKVRHILRKPYIPQEAFDDAQVKLDSVAMEIRDGKYTFEDAATFVSDDKDTRSNHGLMFNSSESGRTSKFRMQDLPTEVARQVKDMEPGDVSNAFKMVNSKGKSVEAIVKLKSRVPGHRATITEDYQVMKDVVEAKERENFIKDWIQKKIKNTYVRMKPKYRDYKYQYDGWVQ